MKARIAQLWQAGDFYCDALQNAELTEPQILQALIAALKSSNEEVADLALNRLSLQEPGRESPRYIDHRAEVDLRAATEVCRILYQKSQHDKFKRFFCGYVVRRFDPFAGSIDGAAFLSIAGKYAKIGHSDISIPIYQFLLTGYGESHPLKFVALTELQVLKALLVGLNFGDEQLVGTVLDRLSLKDRARSEALIFADWSGADSGLVSSICRLFFKKRQPAEFKRFIDEYIALRFAASAETLDLELLLQQAGESARLGHPEVAVSIYQFLFSDAGRDVSLSSEIHPLKFGALTELQVLKALLVGLNFGDEQLVGTVLDRLSLKDRGRSEALIFADWSEADSGLVSSICRLFFKKRQPAEFKRFIDEYIALRFAASAETLDLELLLQQAGESARLGHPEVAVSIYRFLFSDAGRDVSLSSEIHPLKFGALTELQVLKALLVGLNFGDEQLVGTVLDRLSLKDRGRSEALIFADWSEADSGLVSSICRLFFKKRQPAEFKRFIDEYIALRFAASAETLDLELLLQQAGESARLGHPEVAVSIYRFLFSDAGRDVSLSRKCAFHVIKLLEQRECDDQIIEVFGNFWRSYQRLVGAQIDKSEWDELLGRIFNAVERRLKKTRDHQDLALARLCAELAPDNVQMLRLSALLEKASLNFETAKTIYERALVLPNCDPMTYFELAEALEGLGDDAGAVGAVEEGLKRCGEEQLFLERPGYLTQDVGPRLRLGDFAGAWAAHLRRRDRLFFEAPAGAQIWRGQAIGDKPLLILAEQGIGDEIKDASCFADVARQASNVWVSTDPRLLPLLQRSFPELRFVPAERNLVGRPYHRTRSFILGRALSLELYCLSTHFDYVTMAGDLPLLFRHQRADFPLSSGFLVPDEGERGVWRQRLSDLGPGLKVGISWRSRVFSIQRSQHYFDIEELLPVLRIPGVHFVNLQYDECEAELARLEEAHGIAVHRWDEVNLQDDLDSVAALMAELDLVIAPHTMVKELAGAVGAPTLFMAPSAQAMVRWRADPQTQLDVWHPTMRHIQGFPLGDKASVIAETAGLLEARAAGHGVAGWTAHISGCHPATRPIEEAALVPVPKAITNDFGETFLLAPNNAFASTAERNREWDHRIANFWSAAADLLRCAPQPTQPKGLMLIFAMRSDKQYALTLPVMHALRLQGWATTAVDEAPFDIGPALSDSRLAHFEGLLVEGPEQRLLYHRDHGTSLAFDWEIDLPNHMCRAMGLNVFGVIFNRLGREFRCYEADLSDPKVKARFDVLLATCDAALAVCRDLEQTLGPLGMPVRITGFEPNYPPTGVFKIYCAERGRYHGIEFVEINQAYETYFTEGRMGVGLVNAIDVQNLTRHGLYSSWCVRRDLFESWLAERGSDPDLVERSRQLANQNRSGKGRPNVEGEAVLERVRRHKEAGGKIACLYGHIPYDLAHAGVDNGPAHWDMRDWYNHTVRTLADTDTLLLVKPHPTEVDFEQIGYPNEYFVELLDMPPPNNVGLLGHTWLNNSDLIPFLDFGIVWRSTVAVELAMSDVPVILCAPYSIGENILDFPMPKDRDDYERLLRHPDLIKLPVSLKYRAAMTLPFYSERQMIPYRFGWIGQKRSKTGPPVLSPRAIADYLAHGSDLVDRMCREFIPDRTDAELTPAFNIRDYRRRAVGSLEMKTTGSHTTR